jgi:thiamine biosynthesis lipoprotein
MRTCKPGQLAERSFRAIGTSATVVVTRDEKIFKAESLLRAEINLLDQACSRFRADSELSALHRQLGERTRVSPLLFDALAVAARVAEQTGGAVDPTVGNAISALGYSCDFDQIENRSLDPGAIPQPAALPTFAST